MKSDDLLINKAFVGIWAVNGISMLFSIACVMIDAILTGQFLGKDAVTASGLFQPVIMLYGEEDRNGIVKAAKFSRKFVLIFMGD